MFLALKCLKIQTFWDYCPFISGRCRYSSPETSGFSNILALRTQKQILIVINFEWQFVDFVVCCSLKLSLFFKEKIQRKNAQDGRELKKELENNVKTWVRERFGLFTLEFAEFVKGFVEASRKKTYSLKTQSDAGFATAIVFVVKLEKHVADKIWQLTP